MAEHPTKQPDARVRKEDFYETVFARSRDALFVMDATSGSILAVSDAACEFLGRTREEMVGRHRMELFPPESAVVYEAAFSDHLARSNAIPLGVIFARPDGTTADGELSAVVVDPLGVVVLQVVFRGIRERLHDAEDRGRTAARARERQKLEAVALLAGGVAHEINNVLAGILAAGTLLIQTLANGPQAQDAAGIVAAVRRGKALTHNLLGFAQRGMYRKDVVPVNRVLAEVATLVRKSLPHGVQVETDLRSTRSVTGDSGQLADAVMSGCLNAMESMSRGGKLILTSSDVDLSAEQLDGWPDAVAGPFARMQVRDTGHGMDADTLNRAFDPFFTTKEIGEASGLGLSMAYGVVRHHHGRVDLESKVGVGTTLTLDLPQAAGPLVEERAPPPPRGPPIGAAPYSSWTMTSGFATPRAGCSRVSAGPSWRRRTASRHWKSTANMRERSLSFSSTCACPAWTAPTHSVICSKSTLPSA